MLLRLLVVLATCLTTAVAQEQLVFTDDCRGSLASGIRENLAIGTVVCRLAAEYRNNNRTETTGITYELRGTDYFAVNSTSGVVSVLKAVDRESYGQLDLTVRATHEEGATKELAQKVNVLDVNDNAPQFTGLPYAAEVSEAELPGKKFYDKIRVTDADKTGDNAEVDISCYPPASTVCSLFLVTQQKPAHGQFTASLSLNKSVDFESSPYYIMTLLAVDRGSPKLNQTVNLIVTVIDAQDTPPRFRSESIRFTLVENSTGITTVGQIEARDGDGGEDLGRPVVIEVADDPLDVFEMAPTQDPQRGSVYYRADLKVKSGKKLDREAYYGGFYRFNVTVIELFKDNRTKTDVATNATVEIIIRDINDNKPLFVNGPVYNVTVAESLANRSVVPELDILVKDADGTSKNNKMSIRVVSATFAGAFDINPSSIVGEGSCNLLVADASKLDYEVATYRSQTLRLELKEVGTAELYSSTATVYLTISDVNDHSPVFSFNRTLLEIDVREDRPVGYVLSDSIRATDADSGVFGRIVYSLSGPDASFLRINSTTGQLTLARPLDYEVQKELSATVTATDGGGLSSAAVVYVRVTNFNDKAPLFSQDTYTADIREESTVLIPPLVLKTNDSDSVAPIKFTIISGNTPDNAFHIVNQPFNNLNGELAINRSQGFNFSDTPSSTYGQFVLQVLAEDDGKPPLNSTATVKITLLDINNNAPVFNPKNYSATIPETAIQGRRVAKVNATDADVNGDSNKKILYQLQAGSVDKFTINELTGEIFVAKTNSFDVDAEGREYFLQVIARDGGAPVRSDVATVYVTVTDANNKNPVLGQTLYIFSVDEDAAIGSLVGSVSATDLDGNADLEYSFKAGEIIAWSPLSNRVTSRAEFDYVVALQMDTNGTIRTQLTMKRDVVAELQLMAVVRDKNAELPTVQTATATVVVKINQKSIRKPIFSPPWTPTNPQVSVPLPEGLPANTTVITLAATDPSTKEKVMQFRIIPGSNSESAFSIDSRIGTLRLTKTLDYENRVSKRLSVIVEATSPSNATAVCTVIVEILDRNDNTPQFLDASYSFTVSEDTRYPQSFGMVAARDLDSGDFGSVRFSLHGTGSELFDLNALDGTLRPAAGVTLDREAKEQFDFLVRATDSPSASSAAGRRYTDVPLRITLTDTNDNAPNFTNPSFEVSIFENIPTGSVIFTLTASDPDAGVNGLMTFSILSGNTGGYFGVNPSSGDVRVISSLQGRTAASPYVLTVVVSDSGSPRRRTERKLTVTVRSVLEIRGNPVVTFPQQDGVHRTQEEAAVGSRILQARARDPDTLGSNLTFLLSGQDAGKFSIDASSGWISGAERLDRETQQSFSLVVDARDVAGLRALQPVRFTIVLDDINDNAPTFAGCRAQYDSQPVPVVVPENAKNRDITTFAACDPDSDPNNKINFFITCGNEEGHFSIGTESGVLQVMNPTDRERRSEYILCITANNTRPLVGAVAGNSSRLLVRVSIEDEDDNGPTFRTSSQTVFVQADSEFDTEVATVAAADPDLPSNWKHTYEIQSTTFTSSDGKQVEADSSGAFTIDTATGTIRTHYVGYQTYIGGKFRMLVRVKDTRSRFSTTTVLVEVIGDENRLRFVLSKTPFQALQVATQLLGNVSSVTGASLSFRKVTHHVTTASRADQRRADVCFVVRSSSSRILSLTDAKALLQLGSSVQLDGVYSEFGVVSLGYCNAYALYKTYDYLGIEPYWWLFIAMSAVIIAFSIALISFVLLLYRRYQQMCYILQYQ